MNASNSWIFLKITLLILYFPRFSLTLQLETNGKMIVCIAEKPSVARDIARILGANSQHQGYMEGNDFKTSLRNIQRLENMLVRLYNNATIKRLFR